MHLGDDTLCYERCITDFKNSANTGYHQLGPTSGLDVPKEGFKMYLNCDLGTPW